MVSLSYNLLLTAPFFIVVLVFYPTTVVAREGLVLRLCQQFQTLVLGKTEEVPQPRTQHVASLPGTSACGHAGDEAYVRCGCVLNHAGQEADRCDGNHPCHRRRPRTIRVRGCSEIRVR